MKLGLVRVVCSNNEAEDKAVLDRFMPYEVLAKTTQVTFASLALTESLTALREKFDNNPSGILHCPGSIPR